MNKNGVNDLHRLSPRNQNFKDSANIIQNFKDMKNLIKQIANLLHGFGYLVGMAVLFALLMFLNYLIVISLNPDFVITL